MKCEEQADREVLHFKAFMRERGRRGGALMGADYSGGCWEVREVGGGRGRATESGEKDP